MLWSSLLKITAKCLSNMFKKEGTHWIISLDTMKGLLRNHAIWNSVQISVPSEPTVFDPLHPNLFLAELPVSHKSFYFNSISPQTTALWNLLLSFCFPLILQAFCQSISLEFEAPYSPFLKCPFRYCGFKLWHKNRIVKQLHLTSHRIKSCFKMN